MVGMQAIISIRMKRLNPEIQHDCHHGQAIRLILLCMILVAGSVGASDDVAPPQLDKSASLSVLPASLFSPLGFDTAAIVAQLAEGSPQASAAEKSPAPLPLRRDDWFVGGFDTGSRWLTAGLALGLGIYLGTADTDDVRDLGDITQLLPGAFALTGNLIIGDREGLKQFGYVAGTTLVTTHGLKEIVDKSRPDGTDDTSFPSGHTSASVMGAAYLWRRYGPKWGAPASILAAYTGISRVQGQKHFADDVISGMALGLISNWLWTDPIDERVRMSLFPTDGGAGLQVQYDPSARSARRPYRDDTEKLPSHFFLWEIGGSDVTRNRAIAPNPGGSSIDWRFDQENNPTATAFVSVGWALSRGSRHGVYLAFAPFEIRESFDFQNDIEFAGEEFSAGSSARSRYVANDYRAGYGYTLLNSNRYGLTLTSSLAVFDTVLELTSGDITAKTGATIVRPTVGVRFEAAPADRWLFFAAYNTWRDSEVSFRDVTAQVAYRIDASWALSLGYRFVDREIDVDDIFSDVKRNQVALGVWYLW